MSDDDNVLEVFELPTHVPNQLRGACLSYTLGGVDGVKKSKDRKGGRTIIQSCSERFCFLSLPPRAGWAHSPFEEARFLRTPVPPSVRVSQCMALPVKYYIGLF